MALPPTGGSPPPTGGAASTPTPPTPTPAEIKAAEQAYALLVKEAELKQQINESAGAYVAHLIKIGKLQKNLNHLTAEIVKQQAISDKLSGPEKAAKEAMIVLMKEELALQEKSLEMYVQVAKETKKTALASQAVADGLSKLPMMVSKLYGALKGTGVFEMDKAIKSAGLEMGITGKNTASFYQNITNSAQGINNLGKSTIDLGVGIEDLAKMQAAYSSELGTSVQLSNDGLQAMAEMSKGSVLGADGAAQMAGEFSKIGVSATQTRDFVEQTMTDSSKMGVNAGKVIKNIQSNIKMLNKYSFKDGAKGLAKMSEMAAKMGTSMEMVSGMQEKLFDIEGAVDMSAQLQVMGGEWSKLADPFKLMNMARNDTEALYAAVVNATKGAAKFNAETGEFAIPALELHRLKKVAEQTGLPFEELATSAKNAAKYMEIDSQMSVQVDDKELQEFMSNTADFKNGKAVIMVDGAEKLMSTLTSTDVALLKKAQLEKASLKDRAKQAQTFDDTLNNLNLLFKTALIPVVKALDETLTPLINGLMEDSAFNKSIKDLGVLAGNIVKLALDIAKPIMNLVIAMGPTGTLATLVLGKALFGALKWMGNGMALGRGFNMVAKAKAPAAPATPALGPNQMGPQPNPQNTGTNPTSNRRGNIDKFGKRAATGGLLGLGAAGIGAITESTTEAGSTGNILGSAASGALSGAAMLSMLGPWGMAAGALLGGAYGAYSAYNSKPEDGSIGDGIIGSPINDGFISKTNKPFSTKSSRGQGVIGSGIHDGAIPGMSKEIGKGLGSDFNKNRGVIQSGKITPIDNKDDLLAMKPNGPVDKATKSSGSSSIKITFGELKFGGKIEVSAPGMSESVDISKDLLKNPEFLRNITNMVHVETSKAVNGGKISGNPVN